MYLNRNRSSDNVSITVSVQACFLNLFKSYVFDIRLYILPDDGSLQSLKEHPQPNTTSTIISIFPITVIGHPKRVSWRRLPVEQTSVSVLIRCNSWIQYYNMDSVTSVLGTRAICS